MAEVKFEKKFWITVKMLKGKWILFWNSTVIAKVQVYKLFFRCEIELPVCKITVNVYIPCEEI